MSNGEIYIEVKTASVTNAREYKGEQWGEQQAALYASDLDYPLPCKLNRKVSDPLKPGRYAISGTGFGTDDFGNLSMKKLRIGAPLSAAAK